MLAAAWFAAVGTVGAFAATWFAIKKIELLKLIQSITELPDEPHKLTRLKEVNTFRNVLAHAMIGVSVDRAGDDWGDPFQAKVAAEDHGHLAGP